MAGRPAGSSNKPKLALHLGQENIDKLVEKAKEIALAGDAIMLKFLLEQVYGKAIQAIEGTGENGEITIRGIEYIIPNVKTTDTTNDNPASSIPSPEE